MAEVRLHVSVVYCTAGSAWTRELEVAASATLRTIIEGSGLLAAHPSLDLEALSVGVFGKLCALDAHAREGDRIEIYRPLLVDPKEARRVRAELRRRRKEGKAT